MLNNRTGKELHKTFKRKLAEQGCESDEWDDLDQIEQSAWSTFAIEISFDEERDAANDDAKLFGIGILQVAPDGTLTRVDPSRVLIRDPHEIPKEV